MRTRLSRRDLLRFGGLGALGLGLAACAPAPAVVAGTTRLEAWAFSETRIKWQQGAARLYAQRVDPALSVEWTVLPNQQMHDKLLIASQAGTGGPDLADVEISQFSRFLKGRPTFVPLDDRVREAGGVDRFYSASATDPWSWRGSIYGLGNELNTCLLSYRWDLFDQYGLTAPIATWDDFARVGRQLHDQTGGDVALLDFMDLDWASWWVMTLQQGGGFFDADGQPVMNSAEGVRTLDYQQRGVGEGGWTIAQPAGTAYYGALGSGKIATLIGPSWRFSGFVKQNAADTAGKWMLQPLPRWDSGGSRTATWGGTGVCVLRDSRAADRALDFVVWEHTTPDAVLPDFDERNVWPTLKAAWGDRRLTQPIDFFHGQPVGQVIQEVSPEIPKWFNSPFWAEGTDATVRVGITPALQHGQPARAALDAALVETRRIIQAETA